MPAGALFGAPNGFIAATDEAHTQALTQLAGAETQQIRQKTAQDAAMMRLMQMSSQGQGGGPKVDQAQQMDDMSQKLLGAGFFVQGSQLAERAEMIRSRREQQKHQQSLVQQEQFRRQEAAGKDLLELLGPADTSEKWQKALTTYQAIHPDDKVPATLLEFDPAKKDLLTAITKSGLKKLEQDRKALGEQRQQASLEERRRHDMRTEDLQAASVRVRQESEARRAKNSGVSGKSPSEPNAMMTRAAASMLQEQFPGLQGDMALGRDERVPSAAFDVASEAKARMAANRGLSGTEAMQQVINDYQKAGRLNTTTEPDGILWKKPVTKSTYSRSNTKPIPYTPDTKLEDGKTYTLGGKVGVARGGKLFPLPAKASSSSSPPDMSEDEDDN